MEHMKSTEPDLEALDNPDEEKEYTTGGMTRPPLSCIQNKTTEASNTANSDLYNSKTSSSSSHSSSCSSAGDLRTGRRKRKILPCAMILELIE
jgi:hypothetical protein